ncbi:MAG: phosphoribosylanthranilate isomerase [Bacteroidota bacterium]|nr:phosphoribosylanthranilate isomerase [Bacteroidota bacterium]
MIVKICGITNLEDALFCEQLGADMLGFVFYNKSKRFISFDSAKKIIEGLSPKTKKVGVFVNEPVEIVNLYAEKLKLNTVQLHGDETPEYAFQINHPVIKSFRITGNFDFSILGQYKNAMPLLDAFSNSQYGGTGKKFNWEVIPDRLKRQIILAGGISAKNIKFIQDNIKPYAVDLSSSLESEPGKKDHEKVTDFFSKIDRAQISTNKIKFKYGNK